MKTEKKFRLNRILLFFSLVIFVTVSVAPAQAQVTKRDHRTKEKTNTLDHRTNRVPELSEAHRNALNDFANTILFDTGKSTIKEPSAEVLEEIVGILEEYPNAKFSIDGYTDSADIEKLHQKLSKERAYSVMNYLIKNGVASNRLQTAGYGETKTLRSNATASGRKTNRRVEINLIKQ